VEWVEFNRAPPTSDTRWLISEVGTGASSGQKMWGGRAGRTCNGDLGASPQRDVGVEREAICESSLLVL